MEHCDVAVIGLGVMGSAALDALLNQGVDALGFDDVALGGKIGSSHGSCRVFRRYNFESPEYTRLSAEAYDGWKALEAASGKELLKDTPVLEAGLKPSSVVAAARTIAKQENLRDPGIPIAEVNRRFPAFALTDKWEAVLQDSGAILMAETALRVFRARAAGRVIPTRAHYEPHDDHVGLLKPRRQVRAGRRRPSGPGSPWSPATRSRPPSSSRATPGSPARRPEAGGCPSGATRVMGNQE